MFIIAQIVSVIFEKAIFSKVVKLLAGPHLRKVTCNVIRFRIECLQS